MNDTIIFGKNTASACTRELINCTVIGVGVAEPDTDDTIRIGTGEIFIEIRKDHARIVGTENTDEAVEAFLQALRSMYEEIKTWRYGSAT